MNDLASIEWTAKTNGKQPAGQATNANYNPTYERQNNPFSLSNTGKSSPMSMSVSPDKGNTRPVTPALKTDDLFDGLVSFGKKNGPLTMAQQAVMLQQQKSATATQIQARDAAFFEDQLSRPSSTGPSALFKPKIVTETTEDILADINGSKSVDRSSYYPPPESPLKVLPPRRMSPESTTTTKVTSTTDFDLLDSFGQTTIKESVQDDDILGALARPIGSSQQFRASDDIPPPFSKPRPRPPSTDSSDDDDDEDFRRAKAASLLTSPGGIGLGTRHGKEREAADPRAPFIRQIVEMGFTPAQAKVALANTDTGLDVNAAMELLLSLQGGVVDAPRKLDHQSSPAKPKRATEESDWVDRGYAVASKTLANANKWFTNKSALARRKLAEYSEPASPYALDGQDNRPKWMRDAERHEKREKGKGKAVGEEEPREEGLPLHPTERRRLELNGVLPASSPRRDSVESSKSGKSFASILSLPDLGWMGQKPLDSRKFKNDDDVAITSSRRRRPQPVEDDLYGNAKMSGQPIEEDLFASSRRSSIIDRTGPSRVPASTAEDDLFGASSSSKGKGKSRAVDEPEDNLFASSSKGKGEATEEDLFGSSSSSKGKGKSSASASTRRLSASRPPPRHLPYLDASVLATSSQSRVRGSEAFKRGDFAKALSHYDAALVNLPQAHPIRILSLSNRALTQIQIGAPKLAIIDCEEAIKIIGPFYGANETIEDSSKEIPMTQLWSKVMVRKATALEMQEQITDALKVWQELAKSGHGGTQALESRQRCEKLLAPKSRPAPVKTTTVSSQASKAAVQKLRQDNAKQASSEAEKHALYEQVNNKLSSWSSGKDQNIRSLLSSLPTVLPPTILTTWKPVNLADLITTSKVKITYMKALSKVHPDKISRTATVEEKMIAAGVFATLNGAYDFFKTQNNL